MSKTIYEEAVDVIEKIDRNIPYTWLVGRDSLMKIKQTLEKAQKQEELLKLYKRLINDWDDLSYEEFCDIDKQINKLESEGGNDHE